MPLHKLSGGFELIIMRKVQDLLDISDRLAWLPASKGKVRKIEGKPFCWVRIRDGGITVPVEALAKYSVYPDNLLLPVGGSDVSLVFLVKGSIVRKAKVHELQVYE